MSWEPIEEQEVKYYSFTVVIDGRQYIAFDSDESGEKLQAEFPNATVTRISSIKSK